MIRAIFTAVLILIFINNALTQTISCNVFLRISDSLGNNYNDQTESAAYFTKYKDCLKKDTSSNAQFTLGKIIDYDLISLSANKKGGWAYVKNLAQLYLIDSAYKIIKPLPYLKFRFFGTENLFAAMVKNSYWNFVDFNGKILTNRQYENVRNFSEGLAAVKLNNKYGFIDRTGNEVIPVKYWYAFNFTEGFVAVHINGKYGFIDRKGNQITPFKYTYVNNFKNGFAVVEISQKLAFINKIGKEITPLKYSLLRNFQEGMAVVSRNGKFGYMNEKGKEIIPLIYSFASDFHNDIATVDLNGKTFNINKKGLIIK